MEDRGLTDCVSNWDPNPFEGRAYIGLQDGGRQVVLKATLIDGCYDDDGNDAITKKILKRLAIG